MGSIRRGNKWVKCGKYREWNTRPTVTSDDLGIHSATRIDLRHIVLDEEKARKD